MFMCGVWRNFCGGGMVGVGCEAREFYWQAKIRRSFASLRMTALLIAIITS
jgi:hypothetical protein